MSKPTPNSTLLVHDVKTLIEQSKQQLAQTVNSTMSMLYWQIGTKINEEVLNNERAEYGKEVIKSLSAQLIKSYGNGWGEKQLRQCTKFAEVFPDREIVYTLCRQLSWSHLRNIFFIEEPLKREFYIEMCKIEKWSVRTFRERIKSMLYERTAISKKPDETIKNELAALKNSEKISPDLVFREPYFLDFLNLKDTFSEKDLESGMVAELQRFITELGTDFAFLARQKRISIDTRDYYIDLLFYHRRLKSLVAIDLKIGEFDAAYKGEMELYLSYLEKYEMMDGENPPIGLILCTGKNPEHIELLSLHKTNIKVADYFTILPPKEVLLDRFRRAIELAKNNIDSRENN